MPESRVRIFVASPGDVAEERASLNTVVNELTRTCNALLPDKGVALELVRWETHAFPAMGRPQGVINEQLGTYDIFIGILWKRFGTPTGRAESGTEEEFRLAFRRWSETGRPHILFYFNSAAFPPPRRQEEVEQLLKVVTFRSEIEQKGLVWEYSGAINFPNTVRPHLTEVLGTILNTGPDETASAPALRSARESMPDDRRHTAGTLPSPGELILITEIGNEDAWYRDRDRLLGRTARLVEATAIEDGWFSGRTLLDPMLDSAGIPERVFARFRYEKVLDPRSVPRGEGRA